MAADCRFFGLRQEKDSSDLVRAAVTIVIPLANIDLNWPAVSGVASRNNN
jgi:hypothetical protein